MNHLKKIEDRVISILKTNVDARSDDMMLYLLVCNSFYSNENSVGKMPFEVVMKNYKELELPHFESVRRTRAKSSLSTLNWLVLPNAEKLERGCSTFIPTML